MNGRWLVAVCGAFLVVSAPIAAASAQGTLTATDRTTGLVVKPETRGGFRSALFSGAASSRIPFVVPLREAWESGAGKWSSAKRAAFATDPTVRAIGIGVSTQSSIQRADRDPAQWLPLPSQRCAYVAKWISVKIVWGLSADSAEVARLRRLVASCPSSTLAGTNSTTTSSVVGTKLPATPATSTTASTSSTSTIGSAAPNASSELAKVKLSPEYTVGYDRSLFPHWKDLDRDGCDTRKEVLIRDSRTPAIVGSSCVVSSGTWYSPYDGATWTNPSDVDIDHVVALNEAWQSGAYAWTPEQRTNYANDLSDVRTLMAVTDSVNQSKSDKDPVDWLPPLVTYRCTYLANWVSVKVRWGLTMDEAEFAAVKSGLDRCGD